MGHKTKVEAGTLKADSDIIGGHLLWLISGRPGSGKSWLLTELLTNPALLNKKFQHVFIFTPTQLEGITMDLDKNWFPEFTIEQVEECIRWADSQGAERVLIILDDVIGTIKGMQNKPALMKLIFNRRHLLTKGIVSFIITTQKYIVCPPRIRSCLTGILFFKPMAKDWRHIKDEYIFSTSPMVQMIMDKHFNTGEHNFVYIKIDSPYKIILNFDTDLN